MIVQAIAALVAVSLIHGSTCQSTIPPPQTTTPEDTFIGRFMMDAATPSSLSLLWGVTNTTAVKEVVLAYRKEGSEDEKKILEIEGDYLFAGTIEGLEANTPYRVELKITTYDDVTHDSDLLLSTVPTIQTSSIVGLIIAILIFVVLIVAGVVVWYIQKRSRYGKKWGSWKDAAAEKRAGETPAAQPLRCSLEEQEGDRTRL